MRNKHLIDLSGLGKQLTRIAPYYATEDDIAVYHTPDYIERVQQLCAAGGGDTGEGAEAGPESYEIALLAAGGGMAAVDAVVDGRVRRAFANIRPPGHHAMSDKGMGFCIFNNVVIAARYAQRKHGAERAAIVDFDVHHGNGSQDIFWSDQSVMYCSTHQMPLYPGTGAVSERGDRDTIVNAPLRPGDGGDIFRAAFETAILPRLESFGPDLIVISAGFDAHWRDPLANLNLTEADFAWATQKLMALADTRCEGRIVSLLEGGYDLDGLSKSVAAHLSALMGA
ncbi:MAG TPA: histone deacetylase family protein, partial [Beijerinckiaceae bacterium]|nr:histone deacetylase family protein [Beijerinckiaceae bacterium]